MSDGKPPLLAPVKNPAGGRIKKRQKAGTNPLAGRIPTYPPGQGGQVGGRPPARAPYAPIPSPKIGGCGVLADAKTLS